MICDPDLGQPPEGECEADLPLPASGVVALTAGPLADSHVRESVI